MSESKLEKNTKVEGIEKNLNELLKKKSYIVPYNDFCDSGIFLINDKSSIYVFIWNLYSLLHLFKEYEYTEANNILFTNNFSQVEANISLIENKLLLAKIIYYKSSFMAYSEKNAKCSIDAFSKAVQNYIEFILENDIETASIYSLVDSLIRLVNHKHYNQLATSTKTQIDICINKLYLFDKQCYLNTCHAEEIKKDKNIREILKPFISNFIEDILLLDKKLLLAFINKYQKYLPVTLDVFKMIEKDIKANDFNLLKQLKDCLSKLPEDTNTSFYIKNIDKRIEDSQKYWQLENNRRTSLFSDAEINEYQKSINIGLTQIQRLIDCQIFMAQDSMDEVLQIILSSFQEYLKTYYDYFFIPNSFEIRPELLPDRGVIDILGIKENHFKNGVIDKILSGEESKKHALITCYLNGVLHIAPILFCSLINFLKRHPKNKIRFHELMSLGKFTELRAKEFDICIDLFMSEINHNIYAGFHLLIPIMEFCLQQFFDTHNLRYTAPKRNRKKESAGEATRQRRYLNDMVNSIDEMRDLGYSDSFICLLKNLFSNSSEIQAGFNIRNDLMHGAIPLNCNVIDFAIVNFLIMVYFNYPIKPSYVEQCMRAR